MVHMNNIFTMKKIKISVTANDLYQFVMNNQDEDPLVKECFEIIRIVSFLRCMKFAASNQIIWKLIKGGAQKWESIRHEEKMFNYVKVFYSLKNLPVSLNLNLFYSKRSQKRQFMTSKFLVLSTSNKK